jgi:hypothetical protein
VHNRSVAGQALRTGRLQSLSSVPERRPNARPCWGVFAEATARALACPSWVLPFANTALASRAAFRRSVESVRAEGVTILLGPGGFQPHPPRTGEGLIDSYPWYLGLDEAERMLDPASQNP